MSAIPGWQNSITGSSGTQGLLGVKSGYRFYVLPRGAHASQGSVGTTITFDSSDAASRFAVNQWCQVGLSTANIRQVTGVGGNSITVNSAVTAALNDRVYCIGSTQPVVTGGSATYLGPSTFIYQRDDDQATRFTNSMVTANSDGLVQFWSQPNTYDAIVQDGNQANVGTVIDLEVGSSQSTISVFGATVTINAALGVTGWATFASTVTMNANAGITGSLTVGDGTTFSGWARFGATVTMNANAGVTGTLVVGQTLTTVAGASFGTTVFVGGFLGVSQGARITGGVTITGLVALDDGVIGTSEIANQAVTGITYKTGTSQQVINDGSGYVPVVGASISCTPYGTSSVMLIMGSVQMSRPSLGVSYAIRISRGSTTLAQLYEETGGGAAGISQTSKTIFAYDTGISGATTYQIDVDVRSTGAGWSVISAGDNRPKIMVVEHKR